MFYILHFSYESLLTDEVTDGYHGYITCVQNADSVDDAVDKSKILLRRLNRKKPWLEQGANIYFDNVVEILLVPPEGLMTISSLHTGELRPNGMFHTLVDAPVGTANAYGEDDEKQPVLTIPKAT